MQLRWAVATLVASGVMAGCGPGDANGDGITDGVREPDTVSLVAPSSPIGSVSGKLLTTRGTGLEGAVVTLGVPARPDQDGNRAPLTATTDAEGAFFIEKVPAGIEVEVTAKKEGFATLRTVVEVPSSAGDIPINDGNAQVGPYMLTELNGSLSLNVFAASGRPATNLKISIEASPAVVGLGGVGADGHFVISEGVVDSAGRLTVSSLPSPLELARFNGSYLLLIPPFDENGDGIIDSSGAAASFTAESWLENGESMSLHLPIARAEGSLHLVSTNVQSVDVSGSNLPSENMVRPTDSLYFAFNHAMLPGSIHAIVTNEAVTEQVSAQTVLSADGLVVTVSNPAGWVEGQEYNLQLRATSADTGEVMILTGFFWAGDPNAPKPVTLDRIEFVDSDANSLLSSGETVHVYFTSPLVPAGVGEPLFAYINWDLNAAGGIGDAIGELGAPWGTSGFYVSSSEFITPRPIIAAEFSGYSQRWSFTYSTGGALPNVSLGTSVSLDFSRLLNSSGGYYSMWGGLLTGDLSAPLQKAP